jgi:hypothetical protein
VETLFSRRIGVRCSCFTSVVGVAAIRLTAHT